MMYEYKVKIIIRTGMWLASFAGNRQQGLHPRGWSPTDKLKGTLKLVILMLLAISCTTQQDKNALLIDANPYLVGTWKGEGNFLNVTLNDSFGSVPFRIVIDKDHYVTGSVGDARLTKTSIRIASYGFEIRGKLDTKLKKDQDIDRKHLIILLVMPEGNLDSVSHSDANFHLKNNYIFDFRMRVGGVGLRKEPK